MVCQYKLIEQEIAILSIKYSKAIFYRPGSNAGKYLLIYLMETDRSGETIKRDDYCGSIKETMRLFV